MENLKPILVNEHIKLYSSNSHVRAYLRCERLFDNVCHSDGKFNWTYFVLPGYTWYSLDGHSIYI